MESPLSICRAGLARIADVLFPRTCAACQRPLHEPTAALCGACSVELSRQISIDYCSCCGDDVGPHLLRDDRCTTCQNKRPWYDRLRRVAHYKSPLRDMILQFKYGRRPTLDALLGDWMADAVESLPAIHNVRMWVPIPSAKMRLWRRGYQPTRLLADRIARRTGRPRRSILRLTRSIAEQKTLPDHERTANVHGAFRVVGREMLEGMTVGVVDDVLTSGATMREAARTLRGAGAEYVIAVVLAVARPGKDF